MGLISLTEHVSEKAFPTTPGPEGVIVTGLGKGSKSTVENNGVVTHDNNSFAKTVTSHVTQ